MASFRRKLARNLSHNNKSVAQSSDNEKKFEANIVYSIETELIEKEELTERENAVKEALAELSQGQREILFYRFTCNFDYNQICDIMKLKYDSARKRVSRALKSLKKALADSEIILFFIKFSKKY
jgi:RNA polymerase sigma factor (sigma-70 family)